MLTSSSFSESVVFCEKLSAAQICVIVRNDKKKVIFMILTVFPDKISVAILSEQIRDFFIDLIGLK
jgi:hypothetical protein